MSARIGVAVMAVLLALYIVLVAQRAWLLLVSGQPIGVAMGVALIVLPLIAAWALWRELSFGLGTQRLARLLRRREHAQAVGFIRRARGHHPDALAFLQAAIDHAHQYHHAHVGVKPAVNDHGPQGRIRLAARRRHFGHDLLQHIVNAHAGFG